MQKAEKKSSLKRRKLTFSFISNEAKEVFLSGGFNDWDTKSHPMKKTAGDIWTRTLMVYPGKYEYKFVVDGQWITDPRNDQVCRNSLGTYNSVITCLPKGNRHSVKEGRR